ncbi:MAG: uracil-DNA glycosylase [Planctomycetota bacterium]|nr:MAG: uracil-DNA glycosylase [Planctomycetota bacterium]
MDPVLRRSLRSLAAAGVRRLPRALFDVQAARDRAPAAARDRAPAGGAAAAASAAASGTPVERAPVVNAGNESSTSAGSAAHFATVLEPRALERPSDPVAELDAVAAEVSDCRACTLCEGRHHTVPGEGSPNARVMFIGEGPGADEDRTGRPFVGRAGKLLDDIITKGMRIAREDVFIANVVKCRPPNNRAPTADESAACRGYLQRQIAAVSPAVICTLGATATHLLLETDSPMSRLRGREHSWRGLPVIPTYHPAYLLRNEAAKRPTWEDIQRVMQRANNA